MVCPLWRHAAGIPAGPRPSGEAKEKNAKATAKLANEQARLVGISGNSGIGSGAHLDIRASGGGRRLTSAELARFQADGKPLTAYRKTSDYGYRGDIGVAGASKYHRGIDFAMPVGTPITTKVAIKDIKSFYDSKGGGYVQRILFADGLSVDLLHQSPASKGIKGGSSGINTPYAKAQDETSQLIAQQQAEAAKDAQQQAKEAEQKLIAEGRIKPVSYSEILSGINLKTVLFLCGVYTIWNLCASTWGFFMPYIFENVGKLSNSMSQLMSVGSFVISFASRIAFGMIPLIP